jgi:hypothetical protein
MDIKPVPNLFDYQTDFYNRFVFGRYQGDYWPVYITWQNSRTTSLHSRPAQIHQRSSRVGSSNTL